MLQQLSLNQYVFNTLTQRSKLNHICLPEHEFPSDEVYFDQHKTVCVVAVHNNYIVGIDQEKERFIRNGLWWKNIH